MKKTTLALFLLMPGIFINLPAFSQSFPFAVTAGTGIVVILDNSPVAGTVYAIEKKTNERDGFQPFAMVGSPGSEAEFKALVIHYSQFFYPWDFNNKLFKDLWQDYLKMKQENKPGRFLVHPASWLATGLACLDTSATKTNIKYEYRISCLKNNKATWTKTTTPLEIPGKRKLNPARLSSTNSDNTHIIAEWILPRTLRPSYFDISRKETQRGEYRAVEVEKGFFVRNDSVVFIMKDKMVAPDEVYDYRIVIYDYWGNPVCSSTDISLSTFDNSSVPVLLDFKANTATTSIRLKWKAQDLKKCRSIALYRSESFDTGFLKIADLPPLDTAWSDMNIVPARNYYYYIIFNLVDGKSYPSAKIAGLAGSNIIPMPPVHFKAEAVKKGIILEWQGLETWIGGYIVYRADGCKGKLLQISSLVRAGTNLKTSWIDSTVMLEGPAVYSYAVKTFTTSMKESGFSDTVCISPEINMHPPSAPSRLNAKRDENRILITWDDMSGYEKYLAGYFIYRKETAIQASKGSDFIRLNNAIYGINHNFHQDTNFRQGYVYEYVAEAVDIFGNISARSYPLVITIESPLPVSPSDLKLFNTAEGILLKWGPVAEPDLSGFKIYRQEADKKPQALYTAKPGEDNYTDKTAKKGVLYFYYVVSVSTNGQEGKEMTVVSIRRD